MLTAVIGGVMIGFGGKMLLDRAGKALAKVVLKSNLSKDAEAVAEPATQECEAEATEEVMSEDEVE